MGMLLDDEEIMLDKSWVCYIPAGMKHMPTRHPGDRVSSKPILHWTSGPGAYTREKDPSDDQSPINIRKTGALKNAKYLVYEYKPGVKRPEYMRALNPGYTRPVAYIDQTVVPEAEFSCDTFWLLPGDQSKAGQVIMDRHTLPYGTSLTLTTLNYADITDLCAEAELWIGGEKHIINKTFGAYIPPNVEQGPLIVRNITRQMFFMMTQPIGEGIKKYPGG
jgi:hypothetical protein